MKRLRKFLSLTDSDRHLLISTFILLGLVKLGLWLLPFQTFRQLLMTISHTNPVGLQQCSHAINQIVEAVNRSGHYIPGGAKCLPLALTTQVLMNWCGYSTQLRIGVAKGEGGKLEAHAWVEYQKQVIIGYLRDLSRFTPMPPFTLL